MANAQERCCCRADRSISIDSPRAAGVVTALILISAILSFSSDPRRTAISARAVRTLRILKSFTNIDVTEY